MQRRLFVAGVGFSRTQQCQGEWIVGQLRCSFELRNRSRQVALQLKHDAEVVTAVEECWIELDGFLQLRNRVVVAAGNVKSAAVICVDNRRERIEFNRTLTLGNRFLKSAEAGQWTVAVPMMRSGIVRLERDRALKFANGSGKINIVKI